MEERYNSQHHAEIGAEIDLQLYLTRVPDYLLPQQPLKAIWIHNYQERSAWARYIQNNGTAKGWGYQRIKEALAKGYFVSHKTEQIFINQPDPVVLLSFGYGHDITYEQDRFDDNYRVQQSDLDRATFVYSFQTLAAATANLHLNGVFAGKSLNVAETILGRSIFAEMLYPSNLIFAHQRHGNGRALSLSEADWEHSNALGHIIRSKGGVNNLYGWMPFYNIYLPAAYMAAAEVNGFDRLLKDINRVLTGRDSSYPDVVLDLADFAIAQSIFDKVLDQVVGKQGIWDEFYTKLNDLTHILAWNKGFFEEIKLTKLQAIISTVSECVDKGILSENIIQPNIKGKSVRETDSTIQSEIGDRYISIQKLPFPEQLDFLEEKVGQVVNFMSRM